ncbi:MAG: PQQ-binding-like beta-propeller repeat protein, partial [Verrucomicrobiae bacterium]|nr:PQQ-binding-like beta-propeller repeat protein [Verrucomicrobiae bacterium]
MKQTVVLSVLFLAAQAAIAEWNQWRGSFDGQGNVDGPAPVTEWSIDKNILWKTPVHGEGSSSPVIYGGKIYLSAADTKTQKMYLYCFDQKTGKQLWERIVFWGDMLENLHKNNTHAAATPATNGEVISVVFGMKSALWLATLDMEGKTLWEVEVAKVKSQFGTGTSPVIYKDRVIVMNDMEPSPSISAYSLANGKPLWTTRRNQAGTPGLHSYSTPRIFSVQGQDRIVTTGMEKVILYDPETGKVDWEIDAGANVTVGTPLINRRFLYVNGGWPQDGITAIDLRRREVVWTNRFNTYIASMV